MPNGKEPTYSPHQIGQSAEQCASRYLTQQGLKLVTSNYRSRYGEIDLIMQDKDSLVFIEVRARKNQQYGSGAETIDSHKQQKIIKTAENFLQKNRRFANSPCRIDVISIHSTFNPKIDWIKNAFGN